MAARVTNALRSRDAVLSQSEQAELRRAFGCFPSRVAAVCADVGNYNTGMLASSLMSVSMDLRPLVFHGSTRRRLAG